MDRRGLGRGGLSVSPLAVGTWQLAGPLSVDGQADGYPDIGEGAVARLIHECGDLGINAIDTAPIYGAGEAERRVGRALDGRRHEWVLITKCGLDVTADGRRVKDFRPEHIVASLHASLARLRTDYVDVLLYHGEPELGQLEEAVSTLHLLREQGKLRSFGLSSNDPTTIREAQRSGVGEVLMFSQSLIRTPVAILELLQGGAVGGLVRGVFEGGRLTGTYFNQQPRFEQTDIRHRTLNGEDFRRYAAFEPLIPAGMTMAQLALRYVLDFDTTHSVVLGSRSVQQYAHAVTAAGEQPLDARVRSAIDVEVARLATNSARVRWFEGLVRRLQRWQGTA